MQSDLSPNFKPKNIVKSISKAINLGQAQSSLASQGKDWESVIDVLDQAEHNIGKEMSVNSHLNSVMFSDDFNKQYEKTLPLISNYYSDLGANKELYKAFSRVKETKLSKQQKHIVESLDNASTLNEAKLLFESLSKSLTKSKSRRNLSEGASRRILGSSSRSVGSSQSAPKNADLDRWAILAGIKK